MKKVLIIDASLRKGYSNYIANKIKEDLDGKVDAELIELKKYNINRCKGCCACLSVGENSCPFKNDDVKIILEKINEVNGVVLISPNYSLSIPGILKDLFDRLAFVFHRPRLFGKTFLPIIVQGVYGGDKVAKYLNEVMGFWGTKNVKGTVVSGGIYPTRDLKKGINNKNKTKITKSIDKFINKLNDEKPEKPSVFKLMIFRMTRSSMKYFNETLEPDKKYYETNGWLESDYYYKVKIGFFKKIIGIFFDNMIKGMAKNNRSKK